MLLELNNRERDLLLQLLTQELDELPPEIRHTDNRTYRRELRGRREMVRHLVDQLQAPEPTAKA